MRVNHCPVAKSNSSRWFKSGKIAAEETVFQGLLLRCFRWVESFVGRGIWNSPRTTSRCFHALKPRPETSARDFAQHLDPSLTRF